MITGTLIILVLSLIIIFLVILAVMGPIIVHLPRFGKAPSGERKQRISRSPNFRRGHFCNLDDVELRLSWRKMRRVLRKHVFKKKKIALKPEQPLNMAKHDLKSLPADRDFYVWFGHSSYLLSLHGTSVLVDPTFCTAAPFSFVNKPFSGTDAYLPEDMPDHIDYLMITHDHYDHLDYKTILRLKDRVDRVVCPLGVGSHLERWGVDPAHIVEMDWDDVFDAGTSWRIVCLPSQHFSGRAMRRNNTLWASFLLQTPYGNIFAGCDGGYGPHFKQIGKRFPNIDLAILENGQYNELWAPIHTLPPFLGEEAVDLGAKQIITVHHSKYALALHPWDEPLQNEIYAREQYGLNLITVGLGDVAELHLTT